MFQDNRQGFPPFRDLPKANEESSGMTSIDVWNGQPLPEVILAMSRARDENVLAES